MKIYHNPRCSKSRQTLALLEENGCKLEIIEYLKTPPTTTELDSICKKLKLEPQELIRSKEKVFKELGLSTNDPKSRKAWLKILVDHPVLIERPIAINGSKAAIGRPPEKVLEII